MAYVFFSSSVPPLILFSVLWNRWMTSSCDYCNSSLTSAPQWLEVETTTCLKLTARRKRRRRRKKTRSHERSLHFRWIFMYLIATLEETCFCQLQDRSYFSEPVLKVFHFGKNQPGWRTRKALYRFKSWICIIFLFLTENVLYLTDMLIKISCCNHATTCSSIPLQNLLTYPISEWKQNHEGGFHCHFTWQWGSLLFRI